LHFKILSGWVGTILILSSESAQKTTTKNLQNAPKPATMKNQTISTLRFAATGRIIAVVTLAACAQLCAADPADPAEQFLSAYQAYQQAQKAELEGNSTEALKNYRVAESLLVNITTKDPEYQKLVIGYRLKKTREGVARLQASGGADASPSSNRPAANPGA
jgi:hypothetical protein